MRCPTGYSPATPCLSATWGVQICSRTMAFQRTTLARALYGSLHDKLLKLPDATRVFPAHGAGSACGKQLSSETSSTIGEQRRDNYALQITDVDEFVATLTEGQSPQPRYFEFDSLRNREQRPLLDENPPPLLDIDDVCKHAHVGAILLDTREQDDYASRSSARCRQRRPQGTLRGMRRYRLFARSRHHPGRRCCADAGIQDPPRPSRL